jgi:hypothetical protein
MIVLVFAVATVVLAQSNQCMCCVRGRIIKTTPAKCHEGGGLCVAGPVKVGQKCEGSAACWCCIHDTVADSTYAVWTTESLCREHGGQCYKSQQAAKKACGIH